MGNNRYRNINELVSEIEALGDWRDVSERDNFLKVLSKITSIYHGYEIRHENREVTTGRYPEEVFEAIVKACKGKFPTPEQVFDEQGELKPGYPEYSNHLTLVNDVGGIYFMGERTAIDHIASVEFGINVYNNTATREEVNELIASSQAFLGEDKAKEEQGVATEDPERQEKEDCIRRNRAEKKALVQQIFEINGKIKKLMTVLKPKNVSRDDVPSSSEER